VFRKRCLISGSEVRQNARDPDIVDIAVGRIDVKVFGLHLEVHLITAQQCIANSIDDCRFAAIVFADECCHPRLEGQLSSRVALSKLSESADCEF
jgi:hypothetical protein